MAKRSDPNGRTVLQLRERRLRRAVGAHAASLTRDEIVASVMRMLRCDPEEGSSDEASSRGAAA